MSGDSLNLAGTEALPDNYGDDLYSMMMDDLEATSAPIGIDDPDVMRAKISQFDITPREIKPMTSDVPNMDYLEGLEGVEVPEAGRPIKTMKTRMRDLFGADQLSPDEVRRYNRTGQLMEKYGGWEGPKRFDPYTGEQTKGPYIGTPWADRLLGE